MLERYLLSALTSKFGHVFQDFDDNNTTAELSAWRGVLVLRNLHLRKDALMHLGGVPLAAAAGEGFGDDDDHDDDDDDSDDDSDEEYSNDGDNHGDNENNTESSFAQVVDNNFMNEKNAINDNSQEQDNGDDDEDSFQSCASHLDTDSEASDSIYLHPGINATHGAAHATNNNQSDNTIPVQQQQNQQQQQQQQHTVNNKHERNPSHDVPSIEIVHGSIGSLELHIPWRLLRSTSKIAAAAAVAAASSGSGATSTSSSSLNLGTNEKDVNNAGNHDNSNDDGLKCSVVLSDVRILLAPNNHTRGSSGDCGGVGRRSSSCKRGGTKREDNSATKNNDNRRNNSSIRTQKREGKQHKLEKIRQERELAVQSFLEGELFRRARSGTSNNNKENSNNSNNDDGGATNTANTNDAVEDSRDGWLARWAKGLVARILSSLRVTIRNIHIRYEDKGCGWFEDASASSITSMNNDNVSSVSGLMSELLLSNQQQHHQRRRQYRPAFAIGMRLENFSIRNAIAGKEKEGCNKGESMATNDAPAAASATLLQLHNKVANVENLSVYWDSAQSDLFVGSSAVQFETEDDSMYYERRFEELDCTSCTGDTDLESSKHQYIIEPISPSLHLTMADPNAKDAIVSGPVKKLGKGNDECSDLSNNETQNPMSSKNPTASPSIHAALHLPSCHVGFDRNTLEDIAYLRKCYASSIEIINCFKDRTAEQRIAGRLSLLRPPSGCGPKDNPRLWWKYAIGAVKILQENIVISEVGMEVKKRKWRRKGWPGVAHLLRLRNEYTELYLSLWSSLPNNDVEGKNEVHANLMALEELLNIEEIVAFRISVYSRISNNNGDDREIEKLRASESSEFDELALGRLSVLSLEYRETKLKQIVRAFDSDIESSQRTGDHINGVHTNEFLVTDEIDAESLDKDSSPVWTISISSENFTIQANDALNTSNFQVISAPPKLKQRPIVRLDCSFSLRFDVFSNGSWDMSCMLRSLTISDLISPHIDKSSKRRTLVARKQPKTFDSDNKNQMSQCNEHNASILIRNVVAGHDDRQLQSNETQATTFLEVSVSPLEIIYSTNAFEALSRLFAAVKTTEFSRDYERLSQALSRWRSEQRKRLMSVLAQQKKFVVSVAISAPVLVVPDDHQHIDSPTLTIDFGRFTFQSETSTLVSSKFDDKWQLQIANVRAFCTQTDKSRTDTNAICEHAIIEPFSLNFSILTHFAADDSNGDMTKISIEAMLPRLSFNLTTSAVQLVSRLQVRWSNAKLRNTQRDLQSTHGNMSVFTNEISSWRQRHPELFSALRNRGSLPDEAAPEKMLLKKQEVTFSFSAPTIALQIRNDVGFQQPIQSTKHMAPLMNLSIRGIRGHFVSNVTEEGSASHFSARLRSIYVQDIEKHQSHFRHFLSSVEPDILQESDLSSDCLSTDNTIMNDFNDEDEDLVVVEFAKKSNGDKDLSIQFNELYIEWNPEFLARVQKSLRLPSSESSTYNTPTNLPILTHYSDVDVAQHNSHEYEFFDALDETDTWNSSETIGGAFSNTSINNENGGVGVPTAGPDEHPAPPFNISFSLSKLRVNFNKDSQMRCLFIVEMNRTKTSCFLKPLGGSKITATVADMRFIDPEGVTGGTLYSQIIGVQPEALGPATSIVQMEFETFPPLLSNKNSKINSNGSREYDNLMKLDFSAMRFVFISQLWLEMLDYYFEGVLGNAVWGSKPKLPPTELSPSYTNLSFKRTKFLIEMETPLLILPVCYRSPHHIRLKLDAFKAANHFTSDKMSGKSQSFSEWTQWFNNCNLEMSGLDIRSWEERALNEIHQGSSPPSLRLRVRWPVGPTAPLVRPKWNVNGKFDPLHMRLSRKDFSLFQFFVSLNLMEPSRFLSRQNLPGEAMGKVESRFVMFGYEKTGVPPTTYSINFSSDSVKFQFVLDEDESDNRKVEGVMDVTCSNASWSLLKVGISKQRASVASICLTQTSNIDEWGGFPDLLLPSQASIDDPACLLEFTSTTYPNGNNAKTLNIDQACIYMIIPAWINVLDFFKHLPTSPEIFSRREMSSIMQVGDRFYRLSKSNAMDNTDDTSNDTHMANEATEESISKQFLLTLNTPRIIFVADSSTNPSDIMSLTLFMSHLNYLRERNSVCEKQSLFCDGLEIFTGGAKNPAPCSSLLCPLSISGSLAKTALGENNPQCLSGWVWAEELQARAAYSDLTSAMDVFNGIKKQIEFSKVQTKITTNTTISGETSATCNGGGVFRREGPPSQTMLNIEAVCDGVNLVVTDDSCRHFANAQPLIDASLIGLRFSRVDSLPVKENHDRDITSKTFISLDSLELLDLLQPPNSPFRLIATSSQANPDNVMCSPHSQKKLDTMSWDSYRMIESSDWGFQMAASMKRRQDAIHQLASRDSYFDGSSESLEVETLMALRKVSHQNGTTYVDFNFQHLTVQWNPSTIIALQRFLGRMKKATYLLSERTSTTVAADTEACQGVSSQNFSLNASIGSVSLCLNKEYQQRQLLDALIIGVQMKFDRFQDNSLLLQGSIKSLRAWDPDTSKSTSDRNRFILQVVKDAVTTAENETQSSGYFFHFQYRTFSLGFSHDSKSTPLPVWIEEKASSGDIDHALSIKMGRVEFNHLRERTAELLDYLNNGLPGKGMGATSKAAQSFCADRIKKRSFLDLFIDHPQVFIPRSPSSTIGGCYLSLGNLSVKSWFEEARAFDNLDDFSVLDGTQRPSTMDWWRVLILNLNIGMSTEVDHCVLGPSSANTLLDACITMRKPMYGKTTLIKGNISPTNVWSLKYREFRVLNLVLHENIGKSIDESKWENLEKSYWQNENKIFPDGNAAKNLTYADSARFVRFGEAKPVAKDGSQLSIRISIESINITLHRDDWFDNLDEENVAFLCYDICNFAVSKMESSIIVCSNKDITTSISLHGISFTDIGNYGRLARDIYVDNNNQNRPPCAFAVIAEGYGQSTEEPLVSITFTRKEGAKNVEFKVNSLSITVLPRPIEEIMDFFTSKWPCPNLDLAGPTSYSLSKTEKPSTPGTFHFKFSALNPQLILLADESDPFSRALVLKGFAVAHINIVKDEASSMPANAEIDLRSTTTLIGHLKHLETTVHHNIDSLIGPNRDVTRSATADDSQALIEPVTITFEFTVVNRKRFPTSRFLSIEIDPVATLLSFGDLNLIDTVIKKLRKKASAKMKSGSKNDNLKTKLKNAQEAPLTPTVKRYESLLLPNKSSDYDEYDMRPVTLDIVISTEKLGLSLRKSGSSIVVDSSLSNPHVQVGDILISVNGSSVARLPLQSIVELLASLPRPVTVTLERKSTKPPPYNPRFYDAGNASESLSFDVSFDALDSPSSERGGINDDESECACSSQEHMEPLSVRFNLLCRGGMPNGLEIREGIAGAPVITSIDYDLIAQCAISSKYLTDGGSMRHMSTHKESTRVAHDDVTDRQPLKRLPLPGAVLLAIEGKEVSYEDMHLVLRPRESQEMDGSMYTLTFVEADSSSWQGVTTFNLLLSLKITLIDDTNGRDMPVLRAGIKESSVNAEHGLGTVTTTIDARRPTLLSLAPDADSTRYTNKRTMTIKSDTRSFNVEYYNALINQWEPLIEPHYIGALAERQGGNGFHTGLFSIVLTDHIRSIEPTHPTPIDFVCINVSDAAVDILGKSVVNWKKWKKSKEEFIGSGPQTPSTNTKQPISPATSPMNNFPGPTLDYNPDASQVVSSTAELQRATKLAKIALDLSRKRGKAGHKDTNNSPFVLKNRTGLRVNFSVAGISTVTVNDASDAQFEMAPLNNSSDPSRDQNNKSKTRFRNYDGQFPPVEIELDFESSCDKDNISKACVFADPITDLPTDKVGRSVRAVRIWKRRSDLVFSMLNLVWTVELEENRRILTLSSATCITVFGCGPAVEVGIRFPSSDDVNFSNEIRPIGVTIGNKFHLPVWVESCFCRAAVYIRPKIQSIAPQNVADSIYEWSSLPILELSEELVALETCFTENNTSTSVIEARYVWMTEMNLLGGVLCPLNIDGGQSIYPIWMPCSFSEDTAENNFKADDEESHSQEVCASINNVTVWSAMTIRNMLPCNIEWEVASEVNHNGECSVIDSSILRFQQSKKYGRALLSPAHSTNTSPNLECGSAVEVFTTDALDRELHARFKCIVRDGYFWSEWVKIGLSDGTMKKTRNNHTSGANQINIQCKDPVDNKELTIGVKLSPRPSTDASTGFNLIIYAEIWLRNLTALPLTFGAPYLQANNSDTSSLMSGRVSAESALEELTSVLDANGFGLFSAAEDDSDDQCSDNDILPLQQCEEVFDEVFEYISLNQQGSIERKWWASANHVSLRQEPNNATLENEYAWHVDCAGESFLQNGWESCANIAGSKSCAFNGYRTFNNSHRFRRRRWFRKRKLGDLSNATEGSIRDRVIFHQPADLDRFTRAQREAERNTIGVHLNEKEQGGNGLLDIFNRPPQQDGILDIMTAVANDGSILINVKHKDGRWSTPAIIPPSGSSNGVIRAFSSRWPLVTRSIKNQKRKGAHLAVTGNEKSGILPDSRSHPTSFGMAPLEPSVFELCYQVTVLSGIWGELSRMLTITPRFLLRNESSWLDLYVKQVGAQDVTRILLRRGEVLPFYWADSTLPELVCTRPIKSGFKWSGGFDLCTLGMLPLRLRQMDDSKERPILSSLRVNVEIQPGTGGSGTIISLRNEDPRGEGSLFRIENHSPFQVFVAQEGVPWNPSSTNRDRGSLSSELIEPGDRTSYALDVPWRQGKYEDRNPASHQDLLLVRCALAPLGSRDGAESTKVICFDRVGENIRLSPSKLSSTLGSYIAAELLGVRVLGLVTTDGPTRVLRFVLMQKEVTPASFLGNAMRETINPMPSFMSVDSASHHHDDRTRQQALLTAASQTSCLLNTGKILHETEATRQAFFGTGFCKTPSVDNGTGDEISCELSFCGFIFSLIDSSPSELAVLSLHNVKASAQWNSLGKEYAKSKLLVGWFQLDNHCPNAPFPVAICPSRERDVDDDAADHPQKAAIAFTLDKPFLELKVDIAPRHRTGIRVLSAGVSMRDVSIFLDLAFIMRAQRFVLGVQDHLMDVLGNTQWNFADSQEIWDHPDIERLIKQRLANGKEFGHKAMYFQRLTILPCRVKLSVAPVKALTKYQEAFEGKDASAIHAAVRKGDLLVGEGSGVIGVKIGSKNRTALAVVRGMMKSILVDALLRCDGASLNFEGVALWNHLSNTTQLSTYLGAHYIASLISNVPALLGSLAAFGNPLGLMRDLGDGVSDFVNEPMKGFKRSIAEMDPTFVMSGVARGTGSLARHTLGGFADSAAMLTETAAKNMAVLTLDRKYAQRRDRVMKLKTNGTKAETFVDGFESGLLKLVHGILEGVTGVVSKPIRGAERNGMEGFAKGVGKGLLGLVVKPVIGATDALTDTLIGVKGSVEGMTPQIILNMQNQVRPRRALYGGDRVVRTYRIDDATAATVQARSRIGGEEYFGHVDMTESVALLSVKRILILSDSGDELLLLYFKQIKHVEVQEEEGKHAVVFLLKTQTPSCEDFEVVKCPDRRTADMLCKELARVAGITVGEM